MKGKKYTTEEKIRILRQADAGESIAEVCREHNLSEVSFHRWKNAGKLFHPSGNLRAELN